MGGEELRELMRRFPAGVAIVGVDLEGERLGLTIGTLIPLSLEPPLVGFAVRRGAALHELLRRSGGIGAVVFDLDGVLLDSEQVWDEVREQLVKERGGRWHDRAQTEMMGMSPIEWSRYMHDELGVPDPPEVISADVVRRLEEVYRKRLPLIDGAHEAGERLAARWPLGLASSSNREVIDLVLDLSG